MTVESAREFELQQHRQGHGSRYLTLADDFVNRDRRRAQFFEDRVAGDFELRFLRRRGWRGGKFTWPGFVERPP